MNYSNKYNKFLSLTLVIIFLFSAVPFTVYGATKTTVIDTVCNHTFDSSNDTQCNACGGIYYRISYNNGGSVSFILKPEGVAVRLPETATSLTGYVFKGWSTKINSEPEYEPGGYYYDDASAYIYAQYNKQCISCDGTGATSSRCTECKGKGYTSLETTPCSACNGGRYACGWCGVLQYVPFDQLLRCRSCRGESLWNACAACNGSNIKKVFADCIPCENSGYINEPCADCNGSGEVIRAHVDAPPKPIAEQIGPSSVLLQAIENGEYSLDGINWQFDVYFDGLEEGKEYTVYQRYRRTDLTCESEASMPLVIIAHRHTFDSLCDIFCNYCPLTRAMAYPHSYDSPEETECSLCGFVRTLTGIDLISVPTKKTYAEETSELDVSGGVIRLLFDEGSKEEIPIRKEMISGFDNTIIGKQTLTVTYGEKTAAFEVEVFAMSLSGIVVSSLPDKTVYREGEKLDTSGMVISAVYNNGTTEIIDDYTVSGYESTVGTKNVIVSWNGFTDEFTVTVRDKDSVMAGDADGDGKVTTKDILLIRKYLGGAVTADKVIFTAADVDGDGKITTKDILRLRKFLGGVFQEL
ncbi:MAG: hypothetical protein E7660_01155 [Ruminococcaceae bacterium]|nr:hypothetical protein [Oscillospiraceae bacterium]